MPWKSRAAALVSFLFLLPALAGAEDAKKPEIADRIVRTQHVLTLNGQRTAYTAAAGTLVLRGEDGAARASVFHIAYTKDGVKDPAGRPVLFAFNGGPGGAAVWVHLGAFGPKRVDLDPEGLPLPPPARLVDNENTLLDVADLVFVDPVSTGYSRAAPGVDAKQFHGLQGDIDSMADFIRLWLTRNDRWASPKLLAGESYATIRVAGLSARLLDRYGLRLNGIVLISASLNHQDHRFHTGNDMPYLTFLPTLTAAAWYHKKLPPDLAADLRGTLRQAERFAVEEYGPALLQGDWLPADRRRALAGKLARFTGLSAEYVELSNLRIDPARFMKELLRDQRKTLGRIDVRFTGTDLDAVGEIHEFDPSLVRLDAPFVETTLDYLRRDLGYREDDLVYERLSEQVFPWTWDDHEDRYVNAAEPLRQAMMKNPAMKVLIASGYYDLATPYFEAEYTVAHMGLPEEGRKRVRFTYYESGHMLYIRAVDHRQFKADVAGFVREAVAH